MPPKSDRLVADVDASLVQKILNIAQRQRKTNVEHYRQANDLGASLKVAKWRTICHGGTLDQHPDRHKPVSFDSAFTPVFPHPAEILVLEICSDLLLKMHWQNIVELRTTGMSDA